MSIYDEGFAFNKGWEACEAELEEKKKDFLNFLTPSFTEISENIRNKFIEIFNKDSSKNKKENLDGN